MRTIFAGCCQSLLEVGPSRRYLRIPCIGAWTPTPPRLSGVSACFFPENIGLTSRIISSAREIYSLQCNFNRGAFSGLQSFRYVQAPMLARPPGCTYRRGLCPQSSRAVYTTQWTCGYPTRTVVSLHTRTRQLVWWDFHPLEYGLVGRYRFALL